MKKKNHEVGVCKFCNNIITYNQKYVIMYYDRPLPWDQDYRKGLIHEKCRLKTLERFNNDLMRDVYTMTWLINNLNKEKEEKECKKNISKTRKK